MKLTALQASEIILRPYQSQALSHVLACKDRGVSRVLVVMPTGTGKTTLFSALTGEFKRSYHSSSLVLAHRKELLDQAKARIEKQNPGFRVGIERAGDRLSGEHDVVVAGVQSLGRESSNRLLDFLPGCLIIDEAHHAAADSYQHVMKRYGAYENRIFTVGVTATPHRMDNRPLHGEEEAIFEEVAFSYTLKEAISDGWLADLKGYRVVTNTDLSKVRVVRGDYSSKALQDAVNTEARNDTAFENWHRVAKDRKTIVFCTGVQHAKDVARLFSDNGIAAESVDGSMKPEQRSQIMARFSSGRTQVLTNVEIATEGFDVPDVGCVLLLRPTKSWALFCQMIGRGLRVLPNTIEGIPDASARREKIFGSKKSDCIVIDVVDNGRNRAPLNPDGEDANPNLSAVVGLPSQMDLEGHTLLEAMQKWEKLEPRAQALLFRRAINFDELDTTLNAVDLIAELTLPAEVLDHSQNSWMKVADGRYLLACGNSRYEGARMAVLEADALNFYHLTLSSETKATVMHDCGRDLMMAFERSDHFIKETWPFTRGLTSANVPWKQEKISREQKEELKQLGVEESVVAMLDTAGQYWTLRQLKRQEKISLT